MMSPTAKNKEFNSRALVIYEKTEKAGNNMNGNKKMAKTWLKQTLL